MKIPTSRFGTIEIQEEQIVHMPTGPIGFPDYRRFVLLEHKKGSPFLWFQSVDNESLAFVLMDPALFKPDYEVQISPEDTKTLELMDASAGVQTLVVVNISRVEPYEITANLLGPIIINAQKKLAKQVVLYHTSYSTRHPIPAVKK